MVTHPMLRAGSVAGHRHIIRPPERIDGSDSMSRHPVDAAGLVLPVASWPPGKQAPGALELLRRFCNSSNPESGAERFRSPAQLDAWLAGEGHDAVHADVAGMRRVLRFRGDVRSLAIANRDGRVDRDAIGALVDGLGSASLRLVPAERGLALAGRGGGVPALLADLAAIIVVAQADGSWPRLKACTNEHCRWMYYDHSRNSNGSWCSMTACGQRHKAREYRARRSVAGPGRDG
jgi:predicted RNA-binding Zn ribbon-like protein